MNEAQIWQGLISRVAAHNSPDDILAWLEGQGVNELDARRMLQFQVERAS